MLYSAGDSLLVMIYGGKRNDTLDKLRLRKYMQKLGNGINVHPKDLPPSSASAKFHCYRVYAQVQWCSGNNIPVDEWGWTVENNMFGPVMSDRPITPDYLLSLIHCACKTDCSSKRCSCRKLGIDCSMVCVCDGDCINITITD